MPNFVQYGHDVALSCSVATPGRAGAAYRPLRVEGRRDRDLDVAAEGVRHRAALVALVGQALELLLVDPGHRSVHVEVHPAHRDPAALDGSQWQTAFTDTRSAGLPASASVCENAIA